MRSRWKPKREKKGRCSSSLLSFWIIKITPNNERSLDPVSAFTKITYNTWKFFFVKKILKYRSSRKVNSSKRINSRESSIKTSLQFPSRIIDNTFEICTIIAEITSHQTRIRMLLIRMNFEILRIDIRIISRVHVFWIIINLEILEKLKKLKTSFASRCRNVHQDKMFLNNPLWRVCSR